MTAKEWLKVPRALWEHALGKLEWFLERRTQRERLWIILGMLLLFAAVDIWLIVRGFSGTEAIEHIEPIKSIKP